MLKVEWKGEEVGDGMYMLSIWAQVKETLILLIEIIHFPASVVYTNKEIAKNYSFSFDILGNCRDKRNEVAAIQSFPRIFNRPSNRKFV